MKMKQISESTLKITIRMEDLEERGMELSDFLIPQEKTEEFFYTVLDELDLPMTFRESGMLSFRVTPKPDKIDIFVTKSDIGKELDFEDLVDFPSMEEISHLSPDEFLKTLEQSVRQKSKKDHEAVRRLEQAEEEEARVEEAEMPPYIYYTLVFDGLAEAVAYAHTVDYEVETSEFYKMDAQYYLTVLMHVEHKSQDFPNHVLARMLEHADDTDVTRAVLLEHGYLLLETDAIEALRKVELP